MNCTFSRMNYLAHAYLSFEHPQIMVGNMISDFVKGRDKFGYTADVQKGIALHRAIDAYTDDHAATRAAREIFRPAYRLYSGPVMDIIYDFFLANDPLQFDNGLDAFVSGVYKTLGDHTAMLPPRFIHVFGYMTAENWLRNYQFEWGIERSLAGLVRRSSFLVESRTAFGLFQTHQDHLHRCYSDFIGDVKQFAKQKFHELLA
ncbi:MAG TPA: ACP phosphodiesterase [Flavisolibacter sp.]